MEAHSSGDAAPSLRSTSPSLGSSGGPLIFHLKDSPSSSTTIHGNSFCDVVKRNPCSSSFLVQEASAPSIPMRKDGISKLSCLSSTTLICHFNGPWPRLVHLHCWISRYWLPVLKGDVFIHPRAQWFFIVEFDIQDDKYLTFSSSPSYGVVLVYV
jgi:hypothetical protein